MTKRNDFHSDHTGLKCSICQKNESSTDSRHEELALKKIITNLVLYGPNQSLVSRARSLCLSVRPDNDYCHWQNKYSELDGFGI